MLQIFENPPIIEILVYEIEEGFMEAYLKMDYEVWTLGESKVDGYIGKDTWISKTYPNQVTHVIYWRDQSCWKSIHEDYLNNLREKADAILPEKHRKRIASYHTSNELYKLSEYKTQ